eukprot:3370690-Pleurochrysis_carterae.AAC.1
MPASRSPAFSINASQCRCLRGRHFALVFRKISSVVVDLPICQSPQSVQIDADDSDPSIGAAP